MTYPGGTMSHSLRRWLQINVTVVTLLTSLLLAQAPPASAERVDLITGSVLDRGRFIGNQLRPDHSLVVWRDRAPWVLLDVRIYDSKRDGHQGVATCSGRIGTGAWLHLQTVRTNGAGTTATIYQNFFGNQGIRPSQVMCRLTFGDRYVDDVNQVGGR